MNFIKKYIVRMAGKWVMGYPGNNINWDPLGGEATSSGEKVTVKSALNSSGVAAIRRISGETIASLPLHLFKRQRDGTRIKMDSHRAMKLLRDPSPYMTPFEMWEAVGGSFAMFGRAYLYKVTGTHGDTEQLAILDPQNVTPFLYTKKGDKFNVVTYPTAGVKVAFQVQQGQKNITLLGDEVMWFKAGSNNGLDYTDPITTGRESIGNALAADKFAGKYFSNGANSGLIFTFPQVLPDDKYKAMRTSLTKAFAGQGNAHKPRLLPNGLDAKRISDSPKDSQLTDVRQYNLMDMARIWRMQPNKLQEYGRATWKNVEEMGISFASDVAQPLTMRAEQALSKGLLSPEERRNGYYFKFNLDGLKRGDLQTRYAAYAVGRQWGWLSANDIRAYEDMNPIDGGDIYLSPMNMTPSTQLDAFVKDAASRMVSAKRDMKPDKWETYAQKVLEPFALSDEKRTEIIAAATDTDKVIEIFKGVNHEN